MRDESQVELSWCKESWCKDMARRRRYELTDEQFERIED
jgi:hypothetical protein